MGRKIGIDLGTTNSVIAIVEEGGGAKILSNKEGGRETPSVVCFRKEEIIVGDPAKRMLPFVPEDAIYSVKRLMGRSFNDHEIKKLKEQVNYRIIKPSQGTSDSIGLILGDKEYSPVEISAEILAKLKKDAEHFLGEEVTHAVITVPAYFADKQKLATREAGRLAGLTVLKILDEPTAAAIAYGIDSGEEEAQTVLVYDLGGGTFDISVLMVTAGSFAPLNLEGDMWLGGDNFDQVIIDKVIQDIKYEHGRDATKNKKFMAKLKLEAQLAKETLSASRSAEIMIDGILKDDNNETIDVFCEITKEEFEEKIDHLVEKTIMLTETAIKNADFVIEDIDYVLLAGNSTKIPKVQQAVEKIFGKNKIKRNIHPKECVAMGAAITAGLIQGIICPKCNHNNINESKPDYCEKCGTPLEKIMKENKICPVCGYANEPDAEKCKNENCKGIFILVSDGGGGIAPFSYGIQTAGNKYNIFINKGDSFPTPEEDRKYQIFYTLLPNQRTVLLPVYGGDHKEKASENEKQGDAFAILPPNLPKDSAVRIKLWLNNEGIFNIDTSLENGTKLKSVILRGETDQKAVELFIEAESKLSEKRDIINQDKKDDFKRKEDEIIKKIEKQEYSGAIKDADELIKEIDNTGGPKEFGPEEQAEGMISYIRYLVTEFDWLIGRAALRLNNLSGELEDALRRKKSADMEKIIQQLNIEITNLTQTTDANGKIVATDLGILLMLTTLIATKVQPVDPVKADQLREQFREVVAALKNRMPDAPIKLEAIFKEIMDVSGPDTGIECKNCGHMNPLNRRTCEKCGDNLTIGTMPVNTFISR